MKHKKIHKEYFKGATINELAVKYNLHPETIRGIIKKIQGIKFGRIKPKPTKLLIFKGIKYRPETLAKKLGIKRSSVMVAVKRGTKYHRHYQIKIYKKSI